MGRSEPNDRAVLSEALSAGEQVSGGALGSLLASFITMAATVGWDPAVAALTGASGALVLAVATVFGVTKGWCASASRQEAEQRAEQIRQICTQGANTLELLRKIANQDIAVTLDVFTQQDIAERTVALLVKAGLAPGDGALPADNFAEAGVVENKDFVGRTEILAELHARLGRDNVALTHELAGAQALRGEGGIGKTQIAICYAYAHAGDYDGRWWIDASNEAIDVAATRLATTLGLSVGAEDTPESICREIRRRLAEHGGRHLLILDNLEGPERLKDFLVSAPSRVLVTTRLGNLSTAHVSEIPVSVFARHESIRLLRKHRANLAGDEHNEALCEVADCLGDHALAVALAAAYLRKRANVLPAELLERLAGVDVGDKRHPLDEIDPSEATAGYRMRVARSLALHLPEFCDTPAMDILAVAAFCHPDNIPIDVFTNALDCPRQDVERWLSALADVSIVKYGETVSVHRLMQQVVRVEIGPERRREALTKLVAALADRFARALDYRNWAMQDRYAAHAERVVARAETVGDIPEAGRLGNQLGVYLWNRGRLDAALAVLKAAERINRKVYGDEHPKVARNVNNTGGVLQDQGDLAGALACYREAERIDRRAYDDDHPEVATDVNNIGSVLYAKGDLSGALECFEKSERIGRKAYGDDHPDVATDVNNIGEVLRQQGDLAGALKRFEEAERIDRKTYADEHPNVATRVNNIGEVLRQQGDLAGALKRFREAEQIDRKAYGDDHPDVATIVNNIGRVLKDQGDLPGALERYREAERIDRKAYGDDHPDVATDVGNIGVVLYARGDTQGAREKALEAFDIRIRRLGPRSLDTLSGARNLVAVGVDPIAEARRIAGDEVAEQLRGWLAEDGEKPDPESSQT
ncbi:MAG TPA: FxSxx-COOH system tetratricopeptide repeat protein [Phycisphaerae bacterium]|nr:FxSxx-COOH system tetratricopeptide repeat protein [Phycisphaerae bacterium]